MEQQLIEMDKLILNSANFRMDANQERIIELATSISRTGLINPITVRPKGKKYEIVAGNRRYLACVHLKFTEIECIIRTLSDDEANELQLSENIQREDIHPMDEARGFKWFINHGHNMQEISLRTGKNMQYIYGRIKLNELLPEIQEDFSRDWFGIGIALLLAQLTPDVQELVYKQVAYTSDWNSKKYTKDKEFTSSVKQLKQIIDRSFMYLLKDAPFKTEDETYPGGACTACDKNTGCNFRLFAETREDDKARCTDKLCWEAKKLHLITQLTQKKTDFVYINSGNYSESIMKPFGEVLGWQQYKKRTAKDKGCTSTDIGIDVGSQSFGSVVKICRKTDCPVHKQNSSSGASVKQSVDQIYHRKIELISQPEHLELLKQIFIRLWADSSLTNLLNDAKNHQDSTSISLPRFIDAFKTDLHIIFLRLITMIDSTILQWAWTAVMEIDRIAPVVDAQEQDGKSEHPFVNTRYRGLDATKFISYCYHPETTIRHEHIRALSMIAKISVNKDYCLRDNENALFLEIANKYLNVSEIHKNVAAEYDIKRAKVLANFEKKHGRKPKGKN